MNKHEPNDFALLAKYAALICNAAEALQEALRTSFAAPAISDRLQEEARELYQAILKHLEHEFVPPLERRDLAAVAERLFALARTIFVAETTLRSTPYLTVTEGLTAISQTLSVSAAVLSKLIGTLPQFQKSVHFQPLIAELLQSAEAADALCAKEIGALAASGSSAGTAVARYAALSRLRAAAQAFAAAAETVAAAAVNNG